MTYIKAEHLKYRYQIQRSWRLMILILRSRKVPLLVLQVKMEPEKVRSARRSAGWCRSFSKELMAERL